MVENTDVKIWTWVQRETQTDYIVLKTESDVTYKNGLGEETVAIFKTLEQLSTIQRLCRFNHKNF